MKIKKLLEKVTKLENSLDNSDYYKEGDYAVESVKSGKIIEKQERKIQELKNENKALKSSKVGLDKKYIMSVELEGKILRTRKRDSLKVFLFCRNN